MSVTSSPPCWFKYCITQIPVPPPYVGPGLERLHRIWPEMGSMSPRIPEVIEQALSESKDLSQIQSIISEWHQIVNLSP